MNCEIEFLPDGGVVSPLGFIAGAARAGIKTHGDDVALIASETPAVCAAVFTQNQVKAAPVVVSAQHAPNTTTRAIVCNAGNANCCTGAQGIENARRMCELAARKIGCEIEEVLVCSTGIIGHALPMEKIESALSGLHMSTHAAAETLNETLARAVMTTDTKPKYCAARTQINGATVTVGGQAKGVGMIGPDMARLHALPHATMLSFLTTDAAIEKEVLQTALEEVVARTFNSVTVDGDTSTNDSCLLLANGASGVQIENSASHEYSCFRALLQAVCTSLAQMIARDGEGATKLVTIEVSGARTAKDAQTIALCVANSPLVKTAIFGRDPNWGRLAMASGRAGIPFDAARLSIRLGEIEVFNGGEPTAFDKPQAEAAMSGDELTIHLQFGEGEASWTAWTCDFSYDYVKINAEYHT